VNLVLPPLLIAASSLLWAAPAMAEVNPAFFEAELAPGESVTLDKIVTLPEDTPKLDFVLLVDLSGSYRDDIEKIKDLAPELFDSIRADVPDSQFSLATFVDFPFAPWGNAGTGDYGYAMDQDLTSDRTTWLTAVNAMYTRYGGDFPESQLEGLFQTVTGQGREMPISADGDYDDLGEIQPGWNATFRDDATKVIAITTDAAFHEGGDYGQSFAYPGATMTETIDALLDVGVKVIAIKTGSADSDMDVLADATGGSVVTTDSSSSEIATAVLDGLDTLSYTVSAAPGDACEPLDFAYVPDLFEDVFGGDTVAFVETITVPTDITDADLDVDGYLECSVDFLADDTVIGTQDVSVFVPLNEPPVALCTDLFLEAEGGCFASGDIDDGSYDPDGDPLDYAYSDEGPYSVGTQAVTLTVTDPYGESASCTANVSVADVTPATIEVGEALELWPPNHKYVDFGLADCGITVVDSCSGELDISTVGFVTAGYSDEPEDAKGNGDGKTTDDIVLFDTTGFSVRSERAGGSNGRVYGIDFEVDDGFGNVAEGSCFVGVPHSQNGDAPIDDGPGAGYEIF